MHRCALLVGEAPRQQHRDLEREVEL
jgi:hypothetical protein